jgi:hypothetical protein
MEVGTLPVWVSFVSEWRGGFNTLPVCISFVSERQAGSAPSSFSFPSDGEVGTLSSFPSDEEGSKPSLLVFSLFLSGGEPSALFVQVSPQVSFSLLNKNLLPFF